MRAFRTNPLLPAYSLAVKEFTAILLCVGQKLRVPAAWCRRDERLARFAPAVEGQVHAGTRRKLSSQVSRPEGMAFIFMEEMGRTLSHLRRDDEANWRTGPDSIGEKNSVTPPGFDGASCPRGRREETPTPPHWLCSEPTELQQMIAVLRGRATGLFYLRTGCPGNPNVGGTHNFGGIAAFQWAAPVTLDAGKTYARFVWPRRWRKPCVKDRGQLQISIVPKGLTRCCSRICKPTPGLRKLFFRPVELNLLFFAARTQQHIWDGTTRISFFFSHSKNLW